MARRSVAVILCFVIGLSLTMPGTAWAISGFSSGQTAVAAQYPDSAAAHLEAPNAKVEDLAELIQLTNAKQRRDPAQARAAQHAVVRSDVDALATGAGTTAAEKGSIALLVVAISVLLLGGVVRWGRGHMPPE